MQGLHISCSARSGVEPFANFILAQNFWNGLRRSFPGAIACVLMPDHFHLILPASNGDEIPPLLRRLAPGLKAVERNCGGLSWNRVSVNQLSGRLHVERSVRYLFLNPCRAGLTSNPLSWIWSSYRDLTEMTAQPWATPMTWDKNRFSRSQWRDYILADPSVRLGYPDHVKHLPTERTIKCGLFEIRAAMVNALRMHPLQLTVKRARVRRQYFELALGLYWRHGDELARHIQISARQARRYKGAKLRGTVGSQAVLRWIDHPANRIQPVGLDEQNWPFQ